MRVLGESRRDCREEALTREELFIRVRARPETESDVASVGVESDRHAERDGGASRRRRRLGVERLEEARDESFKLGRVVPAHRARANARADDERRGGMTQVPGRRHERRRRKLVRGRTDGGGDEFPRRGIRLLARRELDERLERVRQSVHVERRVRRESADDGAGHERVLTCVVEDALGEFRLRRRVAIRHRARQDARRVLGVFDVDARGEVFDEIFARASRVVARDESRQHAVVVFAQSASESARRRRRRAQFAKRIAEQARDAIAYRLIRVGERDERAHGALRLDRLDVAFHQCALESIDASSSRHRRLEHLVSGAHRGDERGDGALLAHFCVGFTLARVILHHGVV